MWAVIDRFRESKLAWSIKRFLARSNRLSKDNPVPSQAQQVNFLLEQASLNRERTYLEIGIRAGDCFQHVEADKLVGVDPNPVFDLNSLSTNMEMRVQLSDEFFLSNEQVFDVIFLDGLHQAEQTYRDLINGLKCLKPGGWILVDDVDACDKFSALPNEHQARRLKRKAGLSDKRWNGDVYKVVTIVKQFHPELQLFIVGRHSEGINPRGIVRFEPGLDIRNLSEVGPAELERAFLDIDWSDTQEGGALHANYQSFADIESLFDHLA